MRIYYDLFSKVHIGFTRAHPHDALDIIITTDEEILLLEKKRKLIPNEYQKSVLNNDIGRYQKTISKTSNGHFTVLKNNT